MSSSRRSKTAKIRNESPNRNRGWLLCLLIPVLVLCIYAPFAKAPFVYDDMPHILQNRSVVSLKGVLDLGSVLQFFQTSYGLSNRPLLFLTYGWNYAISGAKPAAFRVTNILIHAVNALLLFLLTWRIAKTTGRTRSEAFWVSLAAGCIFAVHPLLTESVTYIAGRSSSLCATFYFLGLLAAIEAGFRKQPWLPLAAVVICFVIGMLIKQDAATLPLAAIALVWLVWPEQRDIRQRLAVSIILLVVLAAVLAVFQASIQSVADVARQNSGLVRGGSEPTLDFVPYMLTAVKEWVFYYLWRFFLPVHLNVDPQSIPIRNPAAPAVLVAGAVIVGLLLLCWTLGKRDRLLAAAFTLILVSPLAAYCVFPLADVVAEHRAYITAAGAVMLIAAACSKLQKRQVVLVVLLATNTVLTVARNSVWMDAITLWEDASRKGPDNLRPHINLGLEYEARGRNDLAISHYKFVLARNSEHPAVLTNLSSLYLSQNDIHSAEELLMPIVQKNVQFAPVYVNLAAVRIQQRDFQNAFALLDRAKEINPRQANVSFSRGVIYGNMDRPDLAIPEYLRELDLDPSAQAARLELGRAYETIGERDKAISCYQTILAADPSNAQALEGLARTAGSKTSIR